MVDFESSFISRGDIQLEGQCGIQPTLSTLTKDCPNPNKNPNPNVHKQDLNSSLAVVC